MIKLPRVKRVAFAICQNAPRVNRYEFENSPTVPLVVSNWFRCQALITSLNSATSRSCMKTRATRGVLVVARDEQTGLRAMTILFPWSWRTYLSCIIIFPWWWNSGPEPFALSLRSLGLLYFALLSVQHSYMCRLSDTQKWRVVSA